VQGGTIALANSIDLYKYLIAHPKMKALRDEAATALVERETGAASGIARAVQAASSPTEGQRVLQEGFQGAVLGGESREQTSTSTDAAGNVYTERLAERTATLDDGRRLHVQQSQQGVQAPAFDQNTLLAAIDKSGNNVMAHTTQLNDKTMLHVETVVGKESDERKKAITREGNARNKAIKGEGKERKKAIDGEGRQRKKDIKGIKAEIKANDKVKDEEIKSMRLEIKTSHEDFSRLRKQVEEGEARKSAPFKKRPRLEAQDAHAKTKNIVWNKLNTSCGWKKTIKGQVKYNNGFSSAEDALLDMERFFAAAVLGSTAGGAAGASAGGSAGGVPRV